jgi:hypothetical protein
LDASPGETVYIFIPYFLLSVGYLQAIPVALMMIHIPPVGSLVA